MVEPCFHKSRKTDLDRHQRSLYDVVDFRLYGYLLVVVCQNLGRAEWIVLRSY